MELTKRELEVVFKALGSAIGREGQLDELRNTTQKAYSYYTERNPNETHLEEAIELMDTMTLFLEGAHYIEQCDKCKQYVNQQENEDIYIEATSSVYCADCYEDMRTCQRCGGEVTEGYHDENAGTYYHESCADEDRVRELREMTEEEFEESPFYYTTFED